MNLAFESVERAIRLLEGQPNIEQTTEALTHLYNAQSLLMQVKICSCGPNEGCSDCPC